MPTVGNAPLGVDFTDLSGFLPDSWSWDFDDDGTVDSIEQHPVHTYDEPGQFSVAFLNAGKYF